MKPLRAQQTVAQQARNRPIRGKIVGLAIGERSLFAAEVHADGQNVEARQFAEFVYPAGLSPDTPDALGKALGDFLRQQHFHAHAAVLGLPAKWLMVRTKQVPQVRGAALADLLRFQSEQEFSAEMGLIFDYASSGADGEGDAPAIPAAVPTAGQAASAPLSKTILLMATPRRQVEAVTKVALAADLNVQAITSSSAALALVTSSRQSSLGKDSRLVLYLDRSAAELTMQRGAAPAVLKYLRLERGAASGQAGAKETSTAPGVATSPAWLAPPANGAPQGDAFSGFVGELRRAVALLPRESSALGNPVAAQRELALWDSSGLNEDELRRLREAVGFPVREVGLHSIGVVSANGAVDGAANGAANGAAVALAICAMQEDLPVDFLHSRLAPQKKARFGPAKMWATVAAAVVVLLVIGLYAYTHVIQSEADGNRQQLSAMAGQVKVAKQLQDRVDHAQHWFSGRTPVTRCFAELTRYFPDSDQWWATQFEMRRNTDNDAFTCTVSGKTSREKPLALPDDMRQSANFSQVYMALSEIGGQLSQGRENRTPAQEKFDMRFNYDDQPPKNGKPAPKPEVKPAPKPAHSMTPHASPAAPTSSVSPAPSAAPASSRSATSMPVAPATNQAVGH